MRLARAVRILALVLPLVAVAAPLGAQSLDARRLDRLKAEAARMIDERAKSIQEGVDMLFSFAELGFQEHETTRYLTGILRDNGFTIRDNVAGMPTGWTATWGSGKPVIGLGSDIDGIPRPLRSPVSLPILPGGRRSRPR